MSTTVEEGALAEINLKSPHTHTPHASKPGPFAFPFSMVGTSCAFDKAKKALPVPAGAASTAAAAATAVTNTNTGVDGKAMMVPPPPAAAGAVPPALHVEGETKEEWSEGDNEGGEGAVAIEMGTAGAGVGVGMECGGDVRTAVRAALAVGERVYSPVSIDH